jgi:hypothetical protein
MRPILGQPLQSVIPGKPSGPRFARPKDRLRATHGMRQQRGEVAWVPGHAAVRLPGMTGEKSASRLRERGAYALCSPPCTLAASEAVRKRSMSPFSTPWVSLVSVSVRRSFTIW